MPGLEHVALRLVQLQRVAHGLGGFVEATRKFKDLREGDAGVGPVDREVGFVDPGR